MSIERLVGCIYRHHGRLLSSCCSVGRQGMLHKEATASDDNRMGLSLSSPTENKGVMVQCMMENLDTRNQNDLEKTTA